MQFGLLTKERSREIDDRLPFSINLEGGENHVKLLADQCTHQSVPFPILKQKPTYCAISDNNIYRRYILLLFLILIM